jgi:3-phosphoshikimate 1-carboxyvinyltransferase
MCINVKPGHIKGKVIIPASKSYTQRSLVACLLSEGNSVIYNAGNSKDEIYIRKAIEALGAKISQHTNSIAIKGGLKFQQEKISTGESGLGVRLLVPVAALLNEEITFEGKASVLKRPLSQMEEFLNVLGATCTTNKGYMPVTVKGPLKGGTVTIDGSLSSQFLTGLLFALPVAENNSSISVKNLKSKSYIDMTLEVLQKHGISIKHENYETFSIIGGQTYKPAEYVIEGDWSNAAFFFVAGAVRGNVEIQGLNPSSLQGDNKIIEILKYCGANIYFENHSYYIENSNRLRAFTYDATDTPDLVPPLAVLAANGEGVSRIKGARRLIHKESNRAKALLDELSNMGVEIKLEYEDIILIKGGTITGGLFDSHNDHRIAMAGAILGLNAQKPIRIINHKAVNKSFPAFFDVLGEMNVDIDYSE